MHTVNSAEGGSNQAASAPRRQAAHSSIRLGGWSFYFIAKLILFFRELIGFHPVENLAFAAFLVAPLASRRLRLARTVLAIPVAIALAYHDSWLPPFDRVLSQVRLLSNFSGTYLFELAGRFIDLPVIAVLAGGWAAYHIVSRYLRVGVLVVAALVVLALGVGQEQKATLAAAAPANAGATADAGNGDNSSDLNSVLTRFYSSEATRSVRMPSARSAVPFDIVFIHICSLSWDDLQATGLDKHPFWRNLDFLFRHFNSAASYSGPAAIRINRATCGQTPHRKLYETVPDQCYLMPSLKQSGFESNLAFNHDGHFDDFLTLVRQQGVNAPLLPLGGLDIPLRSFDNSPIYGDLDVLSRWFDTRKKSTSEHVALFYNTISLHDGNKIVSGANARLSSADNYAPRLEKLLNDLTGFMDMIQKSGRRAIVVIVPEHGAALRGDKFQIAGLREIPTPAITTVPVAVKVVGQDVERRGSLSEIDAPTSYIGLSQLIARLVEEPPYGASGFDSAHYAADLPATRYVAENENTVMIRQDNRYFLKSGKDDWKEYAASAR